MQNQNQQPAGSTPVAAEPDRSSAAPAAPSSPTTPAIPNDLSGTQNLSTGAGQEVVDATIPNGSGPDELMKPGNDSLDVQTAATSPAGVAAAAAANHVPATEVDAVENNPLSGAGLAPVDTPDAPVDLPHKRSYLKFGKPVIIISAAVVVLTLLIAGVGTYLSRRSNAGNLAKSVGEQSVAVGDKASVDLAVAGLGGSNKKLIVNGDVVVNGRLAIKGGGNYYGQIVPQDNLTANRTYLLPDADGTICLSTDNCAETNSVPVQIASVRSSVNSINGETGDISITIGSGSNAKTITLSSTTGIGLTVMPDGTTIQISTTAWLKGGNSGATSANNRLGTLDNQALRIMTNAVDRAVFDTLGNFTVQNAAAAPILQVNTAGAVVNTETLMPIRPGTLTTTIYSTQASSIGNSGNYTSIVIRQNGLPAIVSYRGSPSADLLYTQCNTVNCNSATPGETTDRTIESSGNVGQHASAAIDASGNIHIAYYDNTADRIKYTRCNSDCTSHSTPVNLDSTGNGTLTTRGTSIVIGSDGFARILAQQSTLDQIILYRCTNADCSTKVTTVVGSTGVDSPAIALAKNGGNLDRPRLFYHKSGNGNGGMYVQCNNLDCTGASSTSITASQNSGPWPSIILDSSDFARIVMQDNNNHLLYVNCVDAGCSPARVSTVIDGSNQTRETAMIMGNDGLPQIVYSDTTNRSLKHATCNDDNCSSPSLVTIVTDSSSPRYPSMVMGADGTAKIAYLRNDTNRLGFADMGNRTDILTGSTIGSASSRYASVYAKTMYSERLTVQPSSGADNIAVFQVNTSTGAAVITADTTNKRVSIGPSPSTSTFSVSNDQPGQSGGNGRDADDLIKTSGAKGGDTIGTTGQVGGTGGNIYLQAGDGGNAGVGATNGAGGNISLQAGNAGSGLGTAGTAGNISLKVVNGTSNSTEVTFATPTLGNQIFRFPNVGNGTYDICVSSGNCGGGGGGGVTSLNGQSGVLSIANASALGSVITIDDADYTDKGIASFDMGNFVVTSGAVNTIQDIDLGASPTFAALTLTDGDLTLGDATTTGVITLYHSSGNTLTLNADTLTANRNILLPNESGTLCIAGSTNCGFAIGANAFTNGGNSFGATAVLGTNDGNPLQVRTNGNTQLTIGTNGAAAFQNSANSSTALSVANSSSQRLLTVNTSSSRVELGQASALSGLLAFFNSGNGFLVSLSSEPLTGNQAITLPDESGIICLRNSTNCGFATSSGSGNYINNGTSVQTGANFAIQSGSTGNISALVRALAGQTADLLQFQNSSGTAIGGFTASGGLYFANSGFTSTIQSATLSGNQTINFPDASGTVCLSNGNCAGSGGNGNILNNGNSFGAAVSLGTNDSNAFNVRTNGSVQFTVAVGGAATFQNSANSTTGFLVNNQSGNNVLRVNTTAGSVTLGQASAVTGSLVFANSSNSNTISLTPATGASGTLTLPAETGTLCSTGSVCSGYQAAGNYFVQGGNTFGAAADLGTNDSNVLNLRTGGSTKLTVSTSGSLTFASGSGNFDQSASSGTFASGTGAVTLNGNTTVATGKNLTVNGLTVNTDANGTVGSGNFLMGLTKNDSNTRTFYGVNIQPTINTGASNTNTTLNVLNVDTTNTATTGVTTNLANFSYGGSQQLRVDAAGNIIFATDGGGSAHVINVDPSTTSNANGDGLWLFAGNGNGTGTGGGLVLQAGAPTASASNTAGAGGGVNIIATGAVGVGTANAVGGSVAIAAGNGYGSGSGSGGGAVTLGAGNAGSGSVGGASLSLFGGALGGAGSVNLLAGNTTAGNTAGSINITAGTASTTTAGTITLTAGGSTSGTDGQVIVKAGTNGNATNTFQIQNAAGTAFFTADTANQRINIGLSAAPTDHAAVLSTSMTGIQDFAMAGRYAFAIINTSGTGSDGMRVIDVSDPTAPALIGGLLNFSNPSYIVIRGTYAYISSNASNNFYVVDISNPASPTLVSTLGTGVTDLGKLYAQGRYVYGVKGSTSSSNTFYTIDVSNPASPSVVYNAAINTTQTDLTVQGRYAYIVSTNTNVLRIVDLSNPASPSAVSSLGIDTGATSVTVKGRYAYITSTGNNRLAVYDISNPASPSALGNITVGTSPSDVVVEGVYAYVTNNASVSVINVSNPSSLSTVGTITPSSGGGYNNVYNQGRYLFYSRTDSFATMDMGGAYIQTLEVGGLEVTNVNSLGNSSFGNDVSIQGALSVGRGANIQGPTAISVASSKNDVPALNVSYNSTNTTAGNEFGQLINVNDVATISSGNDFTYGEQINVTHTSGSGVNATTYGSYVSATGDAANTSNTTYGVYGRASNANTSIAGQFDAVNTTGSPALLLGVNARSSPASGSITDSFALQSQVSHSLSSASITNGVGLNVLSNAIAGGSATGATITNNYGIRVNSQTAGTNDYGIAIDSADTYSLHLAGNSGTSNQGIWFGGGLGGTADTNLYRASADNLKTDDSLQVTTRLSVGATAPGTYLLRVGDSSVTGGTTVARFENAGGTCDVQPGGTGFTCTSDERLKKNISTYGDDALGKLMGLNVVNYNYLTQGDSDQQYTGFLAQGLETVFPDLVTTDENGFKSVSYAGLTPYLVRAVQQQQGQISGIQQQVNNLPAPQGLPSNLTATSLNVSGPSTMSSLTVTGNASFNANLTVSGNLTTVSLTVVNAASFLKDVTFNGHIIGNEDTRGTVTIPAGQTEFKHTFAKAFVDGSKPNVVLTASNTFAPAYRVESTDKDFTIFFQAAAGQDVVLNYQVQQ